MDWKFKKRGEKSKMNENEKNIKESLDSTKTKSMSLSEIKQFGLKLTGLNEQIEEKVESGEMGIFSWGKIIKGSEVKDDAKLRYFIQIDNELIEKELLSLEPVYKIIFKLAKYECKCFGES